VRHNLGGVLKEGSERMALDRLDALETRIRDLVKLVQELKKKNAAVEEELKVVRQRLAEKDDSNRRWEQERVDIKSRIEKVLGDIELLECFEERKEVALD
jgi:chromosome segregation ATPase